MCVITDNYAFKAELLLLLMYYYYYQRGSAIKEEHYLWHLSGEAPRLRLS